ncbi:hypothetical protein QBC46DRAFT_394072 [Diplogelasinospora grovesii]|uniref:Uncharacterized protein n=1 Tax=Diplogelasinospora grovesii TaxID=303347 RepID=A0AAN6S1Z1_9PEZI|nr:hypothetical protein QBC46DRAFT_394072 [Diplogelasinospora grovesii]
MDYESPYSFHEQKQPLTSPLQDGDHGSEQQENSVPRRSTRRSSRTLNSDGKPRPLRLPTLVGNKSVESLRTQGAGPEQTKPRRRRSRVRCASYRDSLLAAVQWLPEVAWLVGSCCCVVVLVVVLRMFDGQHPPRWLGGLSLNTLLALLTSLAQIAYLVPVTEGLGQLRWLWFLRQPRSLADFDAIGNASRGPYGSLKLAFAFKGGLLGMLGAGIMIAGLLTSPVTQQAIAYETRTGPGSGNATVSRITAFSRNTGTSFAFDSTDIVNAKRAIMAGAYSQPNSAVTGDLGGQGTVSCSTADCEWPVFQSLGICTKVTNVTGHLQVSKAPDSDWGAVQAGFATYVATLPSAHVSLVAPDLHSFAVAIPSTGGSISFAASGVMKAAIVDAYLVYGNPSFSKDADPSFQAVEILYYWCARSYSVRADGGTIANAEQELPSTITSDATSLAAQFNGKFMACQEAGSDCQPGKQWGQTTLKAQGSNDGAAHSGLVVEELTGAYLSSLLGDSLGGGVDKSIPRGGQFLQGLSKQIYQQEGDLAWPIGMNLFPDPSRPSDPTVQLQAISQVTSNIAASLTNWLRLSGATFIGSNGTVSGTVLTEQTFIRVDWKWLTFLAGQILSSAVFVIAIAVWNHKEGIQAFKTSSLATMAALDEESRTYLGGFKDFTGLLDRAARLNVRLKKGSTSGLALWLATVKDGIDGYGPSFTGGLTSLRRRRYNLEKQVQQDMVVTVHDEGL